MDWNTLVLSLFGSASLTAVIAYILKRALDRTLELQGQKLLARHAEMIKEEVRRAACVFDQQFSAYRTVLSLVYRLRNTLREFRTIVETSEGGDQGTLSATAKTYHEAKTYHDSISNLLFDQRAILPPDIFKPSHNIKQEFQGIQSAWNIISRYGRQTSITPGKFEAERQHIIRSCERVDELYQQLVVSVQHAIGLQEGRK